jgi:hypothetical protein
MLQNSGPVFELMQCTRVMRLNEMHPARAKTTEGEGPRIKERQVGLDSWPTAPKLDKTHYVTMWAC